MVYQRIVYFLKAAESNSFSEASKELYVTSQALTKQIHLLEEELGGALFERSSKGVKLTSLGKSAYKSFKHVDDELNTAVKSIKQQASNTKPTCNIGIFSALPPNETISPLISFMIGRFSDLQININLVDLRAGKKGIINGDFDILLTNYHEEDLFENCSSYYIEKHTTKIVVSLYNPWAMRDKITIEDMKMQTFLKQEMDDDGYIVPIEESFYQNIPCKNVEEVKNFDTMMALLSQKEGFAVFPKVFAYMDQAKMKYFDIPYRDFFFYTGIIYNPLASGHRLDNVIEELTDEFNMKKL